MLLWFKDLMNVTEKLQFIDLKECRNIGSMNCDFLVTFIKSYTSFSPELKDVVTFNI